MLSAAGLVKSFGGGLFKGASVCAVSGVSFDLARGKTLGIVGQSGCGKSTLARLLPGLLSPDKGSIRLNKEETTRLNGQALNRVRRKIQVIFQHPLSAFNPLHRLYKSLNEPFITKKDKHRATPAMLKKRLAQVDLPFGILQRYPHEVSGGELQRLSIARALILEPDYLVLDEATAMLDASTQARILNLLKTIQLRLEIGFIFISHDLDVAAVMADELAVMHRGRFVESAPPGQVLNHPTHTYTKELISYFNAFHEKS
jgi:peptide/nickel transport system ATP-binding protein